MFTACDHRGRVPHMIGGDEELARYQRQMGTSESESEGTGEGAGGKGPEMGLTMDVSRAGR